MRAARDIHRLFSGRASKFYKGAARNHLSVYLPQLYWIECRLAVVLAVAAALILAFR